MLAWLMLRPKVIVGIGALALVLSMYGAWKWEVRGLKKQNAAQADIISKKDLAIAELQGGLKESQLSNKDLALEIRRVNDATLALQTTARAQQADAVVKAIRTVEAGHAAAAEILRPETPLQPGADPLNARVKELVGVTP
jgi:hypothetical protein